MCGDRHYIGAKQFEHFAQNELGNLLTNSQLTPVPPLYYRLGSNLIAGLAAKGDIHVLLGSREIQNGKEAVKSQNGDYPPIPLKEWEDSRPRRRH